MTAAALLEDLATRGVLVTVEGNELRLRGAETVLTPGLLAKVRECKPELLEALRSRSATVAAAVPGGVTPAEWPISGAELLRLPLEDFARAGLMLTVRAGALSGEVVVFASDNARLDPGERRPVYRARELRSLLGLSPEDLRKVHAVKQVFPRATILD